MLRLADAEARQAEHTGNPLGAHRPACSPGLYRAHRCACLLNYPLVVIIIAVALRRLGLSTCSAALRQELTPAEDRSAINIRVSAPQDGEPRFHPHPDAEDRRHAEAPYVDSGEVAEHLFDLAASARTPRRGFITLTLAPWGEARAQPAADRGRNLAASLPSVPGVRAIVARAIASASAAAARAAICRRRRQLRASSPAPATPDQGRAWKRTRNLGRVSVNYETTQPQLTAHRRPRTARPGLGIDINGLAHHRCRR